MLTLVTGATGRVGSRFVPRIRTELGFRPVYPSVHTARDAGAL
jgi:uncharacterized protein YbjT (DUF2867 family)